MSEALGPVTELVPHLRWRVGLPQDGDLVGTALASDPTRLAVAVSASEDQRGTDDLQVLGSLWWQAYAYRTAGTVLAAWTLTGKAPDPGAPGTGVGVGRGRPSSLLVDPDAAVIGELDQLVERLFTDHLDGIAESLTERHRLGRQLVWGDVAAGTASAIGAVATAVGAPALRDRVDAVTSALPHGIGDLGGWAPDSWSFRRKTCCLWWKTSIAGGRLCEDCSLRPEPVAVP
jgi:ferric iron reductase protein FhuF